MVFRILQKDKLKVRNEKKKDHYTTVRLVCPVSNIYQGNLREILKVLVTFYYIADPSSILFTTIRQDFSVTNSIFCVEPYSLFLLSQCITVIVPYRSSVYIKREEKNLRNHSLIVKVQKKKDKSSSSPLRIINVKGKISTKSFNFIETKVTVIFYNFINSFHL